MYAEVLHLVHSMDPFEWLYSVAKALGIIPEETEREGQQQSLSIGDL